MEYSDMIENAFYWIESPNDASMLPRLRKLTVKLQL